MSDKTVREENVADTTIRERVDANVTIREEAAANETIREDVVPNATIQEEAYVNATIQDRPLFATVREQEYYISEGDSAPTFLQNDAVQNVASAPTIRETTDASTVFESVDAARSFETIMESPQQSGQTLQEINSSVHSQATQQEANSNLTLQETNVDQSSSPRANLPRTVELEYEWVRDLKVASGEAYVSIIRERATGVERFFKHYHSGIYPDGDVLSILQEDSNKEHVVQIIDFSSDPEDAWEIQEYCPLGTLGAGEWVSAHAYPYDDKTLQQIVYQVSEAIHHIHHIGSGLAHRDIKPSNILIRSDGPLNLVLTDFGIARADQLVTHRTTFAGTNAYAAPEAHQGKSSQKSDWFSLGAIVYELITGQKLLTSKVPVESSAHEFSANCLSGAYYGRVEDIPEDIERWKLLIKGLVEYDHNYRWGYAEVNRWRNGESPAVYWSVLQNRYAGVAVEKRYQPSWCDELITTPDQLAKSIGKNWNNAKKALAGREAERIKEFLSNYADQPGMSDVFALLDSKKSLDSKLFELQLMLDPGNAPAFEGISIDTETLKKQIEIAYEKDAGARIWLRKLVRSNALISYGEYKESNTASVAGKKLKEWYEQAEAVKKEAPREYESVANEAFLDALPELFELAFNWKDKNGK